MYKKEVNKSIQANIGNSENLFIDAQILGLRCNF